MNVRESLKRDVYNELHSLGDGTYMVGPEYGIVNWAERWSYGYVVAERELFESDLDTAGVLVGVWRSTMGVEVDLVRHIATLQEALDKAKEWKQDAIYDLRDEVVVPV